MTNRRKAHTGGKYPPFYVRKELKRMKYYPTLNAIIQSEPHFLIGGTTGSGKSVLIDTVVRSLSAAVPVNLCLLDPKRVEFMELAKMRNVYRHETTADGINAALYEACGIMENRYKHMMRHGQKQSDKPPIYIVVDEIADLMLTTPKETTPLLQRLAQIGRAANIHLILATQVIRADILPLKITSNVSGRIALRCRNALESRQIIGTAGAELLPRYGQALVSTADGLKRIEVPMY